MQDLPAAGSSRQGAEPKPARKSARSIAVALGLMAAAAGGLIALTRQPSHPPPLDLAAVDQSAYPETLDLTAGGLPVLARRPTDRIDFGTPEARHHLLTGWSSDERLDDGTTIVWGVGPESAIRFSVLEPADRVLRARVWPCRQPGKTRQKIRFELNGHPLDSRRLESGPQQLKIELPREAQVPGLNRLILRYRWRCNDAGRGPAHPRVQT